MWPDIVYRVVISNRTDFNRDEKCLGYEIVESIDADLLYQISMILNVDLFRLFSEKLREENKVINATHLEKVKTVPSGRRVMLEVELDDDEFKQLVYKALEEKENLF